MKRGPRPTPTETLKQRGSWRANEPRRQGEATPDPLPEVPEAPAWLCEAARDMWAVVAGDLHTAGLLTAPDLPLCGALCERLAAYVALRDDPETASPTVRTETTVKPNPRVQLRDQALADCVKYMRELGMSPTSRVGLVISPPGAKPDIPRRADGSPLFAKDDGVLRGFAT